MKTLNHHELAALAAVLQVAIDRMQARGENKGPGYRRVAAFYESVMATHGMDPTSFAHYRNRKMDRVAALMEDDWGAGDDHGPAA